MSRPCSGGLQRRREQQSDSSADAVRKRNAHRDTEAKTVADRDTDCFTKPPREREPDCIADSQRNADRRTERNADTNHRTQRNANAFSESVVDAIFGRKPQYVLNFVKSRAARVVYGD